MRWSRKWDSLDKINKILEELENIGLTNRKLNKLDLEQKPYLIVPKLNLKKVIQERVVERRVRSVAKDHKEYQTVCELDMDIVTYTLEMKGSKTDARLYNIEIESKIENNLGTGVISSIMNAIIERFSPFVIKWNYSKFEMGKALKKPL